MLHKPPTASAAGLYTGDQYLGFYSGGFWRTYMDYTGHFYLTGSSGNNFLAWDGSNLQVQGTINIQGGNAVTTSSLNTSASALLASSSLYASVSASAVSNSLAPNIFTDSTDPNRASIIGREWGIEIYLGHSLATSYRAFYGKIKDVVIQRPGTNLQLVTLICVGWGIILRERLSRLTRSQAKQSDGVTLDDTDTSTRIDNLILDLFRKKDHQVDDNITQLTNITAQTSTTGNGICEDCTGPCKVCGTRDR